MATEQRRGAPVRIYSQGMARKVGGNWKSSRQHARSHFHRPRMRRRTASAWLQGNARFERTWARVNNFGEISPKFRKIFRFR